MSIAYLLSHTLLCKHSTCWSLGASARGRSIGRRLLPQIDSSG